MWYEKSYRRHLCDMHIEDWDSIFLSEFSPEEYYENLVKAKIQNAMIYFQSHVGYCYYPTKIGHMHKAFDGKEDLVKRLVDMCRNSGISVTGYYSLIYNNWAHDNFPQWRMVGIDGRSIREGKRDSDFTSNGQRYGLCCPNNAEYRSFVFKQIREINDYFDFDGMFFDMLFWPHMCYCESCRERWRKEVGGDIPSDVNWDDEKWLLHVRKRREWMGEFAQTVTDEMKRLRPDISVEHNFSTALRPDWNPCCGEPVNSACDYTGGDLYGGILEQSFTCKFYRNITENQPFEYMFSRCEPNLTKHTITKSDDVMSASVFLTCAHHGATLVIDAIDPIGTLDERVYDKIGRIFEKEKKYEPYLNGEMIEDIGVYYSLKSKFALNGNEYTNHICAVETVKTLIENHISVGITGGWHDLSKYKVLFASCLTLEDEYDNKRIIDYVKNGGILYFSGGDNKKLVEDLFGGKVKKVTDENVVYIAPKDNSLGLFEYFNKKYPLPINGRIPVVEGAVDEEVIAEITLPYTNPHEKKFASIHSNPPGIDTNIPAIIIKDFGKGKIIWSAAPIESLKTGEYKRILLNLLFNVLDKKDLSITANAPKNVEIVSFREEYSILISAVLLNEEYKADPVSSFEIRILSVNIPKSIVLLPDNQDVSFHYDGKYIYFKTRTLNIFDMYKIIF